MIKERYRAYPEYKDSGGVWLGNVPVHWSTSKIGYLSCKTGSGKTPKGGSEVYSDDGVLFLRSQNIYDFGLKIDKNDVVFISDNIDAEMSSSRVLAGDILLNITGASIGRTCIVPIDFQRANVNQHVCIIRVPLALQEYVALCLKSTVTKAQIDAAQNGAAREGLNFEQLSKIEIALPENKAEQEQIANFLDHETAKIDTLIEKQQQLIALLMEKRQAVISHAVTKGLNPDVPMKHSGVEWLGEVPAHWSVTYLTHLVPNNRKIMYGIILPGPNVEIGVPIVKGGDVKPGRLNLESLCKTTFEIESNYERSRLLEGDLVYSIRGTIGDVEIVPGEIEGANLTQDAARISPDVGVDKRWLKYTLESIAIFSQLEIGSLGAAVKGINIRDLKKAIVPKPPEAEMVKIAIYLDDVLGKLSLLSKKCDNQISLLQERRTALISAAVTGKIDVRNWQPPTTPQNSPENQ